MSYLTLKNKSFREFAFNKFNIPNNDIFLEFSNFNYVNIKYNLLSFSCHKKLKVFHKHIVNEILKENMEYIELFKDNSIFKTELYTFNKDYISEIVIKLLEHKNLEWYEYFISTNLYLHINEYPINTINHDNALICKYISKDVLKQTFDNCDNNNFFFNINWCKYFLDYNKYDCLICYIELLEAKVCKKTYTSCILGLLEISMNNDKLFKLICSKMICKENILFMFVKYTLYKCTNIKVHYYIYKTYDITIPLTNIIKLYLKNDKYSKIVNLLLIKHKFVINLSQYKLSYNNFLLLNNHYNIVDNNVKYVITNTSYNFNIFKYINKRVKINIDRYLMTAILKHKNINVIEFIYDTKLYTNLQLLFDYCIGTSDYTLLDHVYNKYKYTFDQNDLSYANDIIDNYKHQRTIDYVQYDIELHTNSIQIYYLIKNTINSKIIL